MSDKNTDVTVSTLASTLYSPSQINYYKHFLHTRAINEKRKIYRWSLTGTGTRENAEILTNMCLKNFNVRKLFQDNEDELYFKSKTLSELNSTNNDVVGEETYCSINSNDTSNYFYACIESLNRDHVKQFVEMAKGMIGPEKKGSVYTIVHTSDGYSFQNLGVGFIDLERGNYSQDILKAYDHIVKDIKEKKPCGKFSFFEGKPGTGKTHLIRAFLGDIYQDTCAIVIPPNMINEISSPEMINLFISNKDNFAKNKSYSLIIEDADSILVTRAADNMSSIQSILNLSDGILGSLMDMRIIATTNAINEVDEALVRPGRLCRRVEVGETSVDLCNSIYKRLTQKEGKFTRPHTLAEIYRSVYDINCEEKAFEEKPIKKVLGFGQ